MPEAGKALKKMAVWAGLILLCAILRDAEKALMPLPRNFISLLYLPILSLLLVSSFSTRIVERNGLKFWLLSVAWLIFAFICVREIRYSAFPAPDWFSRFLWYLYYVPMLLIPLCSFYASVMISAREKNFLPGKWAWLCAVAFALIALVLTNDLHQQVFSFRPNFADYGTDYDHRWGYYLVAGWVYGLYFASLIAMIRRCRLTTSRSAVWVPAIPIVLGGAWLIGQMFGYDIRIHGQRLFNFPEIFCFSIAFFWESCIQIGLIPTNEDYGKMLKKLSLPVWISSRDGQVVYCSDAAGELPAGLACRDGDVVLNDNAILHGRTIAGGYGFWQEDITEINGVQSQLQDLQEQLKEESVLISLDNKRKEEQAHIDEQNALYDRIALLTQTQSAKIHALAKEARETEDAAVRKRNAAHICFLGAYIKRISNLMLLENSGSRPGTGELHLSVSESFRYLEKMGISCAMGENPDAPLAAGHLIAAYRIFESALEDNLETLTGAYAAFEQGKDLCFRLVLENAKRLPPVEMNELAFSHSMELTCRQEDDTLYLRLLLQKGGEGK